MFSTGCSGVCGAEAQKLVSKEYHLIFSKLVSGTIVKATANMELFLESDAYPVGRLRMKCPMFWLHCRTTEKLIACI